MTKQTPNPVQKLVRGFIRDLIHQANSEKADKSKKPKVKKSAAIKSRAKPKQDSTKRSRHIPASVRVSVLHNNGYKCVFCGRSSQQVQLEVDHDEAIASTNFPRQPKQQIAAQRVLNHPVYQYQGKYHRQILLLPRENLY